MISQENIDRIEGYLNHQLSAEEQAALEAQLAADQELAAEFDRRETAHLAVDFMISESLRSELKTLEATQSKIVSMGSRRRRLFPLAIAASIVILLGALFFIQTSRTIDPSYMAAAHYESPDFTFRSEGQAMPQEIISGSRAIRNKDYGAAIASLSSISDDQPFAILADYYLGHAYYLSEDYSMAQSKFSEIANSGDLRYAEDAQWYALLSCLAQDKSCQVLLDNIRNNDHHTYHDQAIEINNQLK